MKIEVPLEVLWNVGCSDKCYIRRECPQNPTTVSRYLVNMFVDGLKSHKKLTGCKVPIAASHGWLADLAVIAVRSRSRFLTELEN
jgi:hypothetical protein